MAVMTQLGVRVAFLADLSSYIAGSVIEVGGGRYT